MKTLRLIEIRNLNYISGYGVIIQIATNGYANDLGSVLLGWYETNKRNYCESLLVPCMEYMQLSLPSVRINHDIIMETVAWQNHISRRAKQARLHPKYMLQARCADYGPSSLMTSLHGARCSVLLGPLQGALNTYVLL